MFKECDYIKSSHKSDVFSREKKTFLVHALTTYSELPSNIITIGYALIISIYYARPYMRFQIYDLAIGVG